MDYGLIKNLKLCHLLVLLWIFVPLTSGQSLPLPKAQQTLYVDMTTKGVLGRSVQLSCGETLPNIYIWSFTTPDTGSLQAVLFGTQGVNVLDSKTSQYGKIGFIAENASLTINNLQLQAMGRFTCQAFNMMNDSLTLIYFNTDLTVLVPVAKPEVRMSRSSPEEGTPVTVQCLLKAGTPPINYMWTQEATLSGLTVILTEDSNLVNVTSVHRNHTGRYICKVSNEVNEESSDGVWMNVTYGPDEPVITIFPLSITERGFTANEEDTISLICQAASNPPSSYFWLYNNSQVSVGQTYQISKISRRQTGSYTCQAENRHLNTRAQTSISLTVYYLPDGKPTCKVIAANAYKDLSLWCSWDGGLPPATLRWVSISHQDNGTTALSNVTAIKIGVNTPSRSTFTCLSSHPALPVDHICKVTAYLPPENISCFAISSKDNDFIMLSCNWEEAMPPAMLWWDTWDGVMLGSTEESVNMVVLKSNTSYSGKEFTCSALHPQSAEKKQCQLRLESPTLLSPRSEVTVLEMSEINLTCTLSSSYPASDIIWYDNKNKPLQTDLQKYVIYHIDRWSNLTIKENVAEADSGKYRCSATNAVGSASVWISLNVYKYPPPPNVTISKILYSRQRTDVFLEWMTLGKEEMTEFIVQRQERPAASITPESDTMSKSGTWETVASKIKPNIRGQKLSGVDSTVLYAFRIVAVNHNTRGYPSEWKTPADPPFTAYTAIIGAALGGMLVAAVAILLVFQYIRRNPERNPWLHNILFRVQPDESRENISIPEDAEAAADSDTGIVASTDTTTQAAQPATGSTAPVTTAAAALSQLSSLSPPGDEPVNVTITVTATP
ncbi:V-set and immunoglobulin domain-containing protein 10-like 2 [Protopterus annectens]|uniref:V-set and immunoglobulin domain-containing protein 10-like 2 n=1 Tax=Protopterus annectens TaxID=7888 RepID=UPI001CF9615A|nr:V-set and immunoglobulin domain-containing protein 10-like 2 [Protopterus annectens]